MKKIMLIVASIVLAVAIVAISLLAYRGRQSAKLPVARQPTVAAAPEKGDSSEISEIPKNGVTVVAPEDLIKNPPVLPLGEVLGAVRLMSSDEKKKSGFPDDAVIKYKWIMPEGVAAAAGPIKVIIYDSTQPSNPEPLAVPPVKPSN